MAMLFCPKLNCRYNNLLTDIMGKTFTGVCEKETVVLEIYPSDEKPAACADYEEETVNVQ